jgi:hypothetical protein
MKQGLKAVLTAVLVLCLSVLALLLVTHYAKAADVYTRTSAKDTLVQSAATPTEKSWTALWASALAGYTMSNTDLGLDYLHEDKFNRLATVQGFGGEGFEGTLQLGGDVQVGALTLGGWLEYSFGGSQAGVGVAGLGKLEVDQSDSSCGFGRLGLPRGDTLWYAAGGYCWTTFEAKLTTLAAGGALTSERRDLGFEGPAAEIGVEHRFSDNLRGKLSGRYELYEQETVLRGEGGRLTAEPGELKLKAGIVISTGGNIAGLLDK